MTENQKRVLKKIGKFTVYTAMTGGAYFLARGAISLLLRKLEVKTEAKLQAQHEKTEPPAKQSPSEMEAQAGKEILPGAKGCDPHEDQA